GERTGRHHVSERGRGRRRAPHARLVHVRARVGVLVPPGRPSVRRQANGRTFGRRMSLVSGTTDVLIVGGGPVGLTLAVDLGRRGVRCTLIEKKPAPEFLPKMERCNARS